MTGIAIIQANLDMADDRERRFRTYSNYIEGWLQSLRNDGVSDVEQVEAAMKSVPAGRPAASIPFDAIREHYQRGEMTLELMRQVSRSGSSSLVSVGSLWLPVQAYYAVLAFGCATLVSVNQMVPANHAASKRAIGSIIERTFPRPLAVTVVWDDESALLTLPSSDCSPAEASSHSQLSHVSSSTAGLVVAKSLLTTHKRLYELDVPEEKKRLGRKRLASDHRAAIHRRHRRLGVVDFLWRLRCRSNYESAEAYMHAADAPWDAITFCEGLTSLTELIAESFKIVIQNSVGAKRMSSVTRR